MRFTRRLPAKVLAACLLAAVLCGCGDDDRSLGGLGNPTLAGSGRSAPRIEGSWAWEAADTTDTCGSASYLFDDEGRLALVRADTRLAFAISGACDAPLAEGEGTVLHDGTTALEYQRKIQASAACLLTLTAGITGTVDLAVNAISGSHTLEVRGEGECGAALPCEIAGAFSATRCPAGGCEPLECAPPGDE